MVSWSILLYVVTTNIHPVELLPSADLIIAFDKAGNVVEHGTFERLNANQGYIQSLAIKNASATSDNENNEEGEPDESPALKTFEVEPASAIDPMSDSSRQNGDFSVYKYYFDTVGIWWCGLFFVTLAAFSFFYVFSSKSEYLHMAT